MLSRWPGSSAVCGMVEWFWFTPVTLWAGSKVFWSYLSKDGTFQIVPYTNRRKLVFTSSEFERFVGEKHTEASKASKFRGKILPATHPGSVRVNLIANNIFEALNRGLNKYADVSRLVGLNWEVLVVDKPLFDAGCVPGGKVVVFTRMFKHFESDAEIALVIARQDGLEADHIGLMLMASAGYDPRVALTVYKF